MESICLCGAPLDGAGRCSVPDCVCQSKTTLLSDLSQFIGTEHWYRHSLARRTLYTDGIKYLAEIAGAYWLIDEICLSQGRRELRGQEFQVWNLVVTDSRAALVCDDGNDNLLFGKDIEFTDFPLPEIKLYFEGAGDGSGVLLLPSEH